MGVHAFPQRVYSNDSYISYFQTTDFTQWTMLDPLNMIHQDTYADGTLTIQTKAISNDELQISGSAGVCKAPRWYTLAYYDDGTPVMAGDNFIVTVCAEHTGSSSGYLQYVTWALGVCEDPTSTDVTVIGFNGIGTAWNGFTSPADNIYVYGYIISQEAASAQLYTLSPNDTHTIGTIQMCGGSGNLCATSIDVNGSYEASAIASAVTTEYTPTNQLYVCLMLGAKGTGRSFSLGDEAEIKLKYKFSKLDNASMGL